MPLSQEGKTKIMLRRWILTAGIFLALASMLLFVVDVRNSQRQRNSMEYAADILQMRARRTAELAEAIETISYQFLTNQILNDTLSSYITDSEDYDVSRWNVIFSEYIEGLAETVPELRDAVFFDATGKNRIPLTMSDSLTRSLWIPVRAAIMGKALIADGRTTWGILSGGGEFDEQSDGPTPSILLCARLIKRRSDHKALGVLILLIDPDRLARTVSGYSQDEGIAVSQKTDYSVLMEGQGTILASVDPAFAMKPVAEAIPGYKEHFSGKTPIAEAGSYKYRAVMGESGKTASYGVVYCPIPDREWTLISILPLSSNVLSILGKIALGMGFLGAIWLIYSTLRNLAADKTVAVEASALRSKQLTELPPWYSALTPKEQTILLFLLTGKSNKEIAYLLDIREQTVKNHLHAIYQQIGAKDRFSALILMQEAGLTLESLRLYTESHPEFCADSRLFC